MPGQQPKVDRNDWAVAAHQALTKDGPDAVTVEGIARRLGVTKGSFYWHYRSRAELLAAALERWEATHTQALIDRANTAGAPLDRLLLLFELVSAGRTEAGELAMYSGGSTSSPPLAEALHRVSHARIDYVVGLLVELGIDPAEAQIRAQLALAMAIGQRMLARSVPDLAVPASAMLQTARLAVGMLTGPTKLAISGIDAASGQC